VSGYYIDLAVKYKVTDDYILAIECDGATYHSSQYARDRDKLKDEVLQNLGWNIHRTWSVDWYKNRNEEIKRLLDAVKKAEKIYEEKFKNKKNSSIKLKSIKKVQTIQRNLFSGIETLENKEKTLKEELLKIKEKIEKTFRKSTLLSPYMIDLLTLNKPIDMDEFMQVMEKVIKKIKNKEELIYIDEIFEIIEKYS